jgi:hypothetical protein
MKIEWLLQDIPYNLPASIYVCEKLHNITDLKPVFDAKRLNETFYRKPLLNQCSGCGEYVILNYGSEYLKSDKKEIFRSYVFYQSFKEMFARKVNILNI